LKIKERLLSQGDGNAIFPGGQSKTVEVQFTGFPTIYNLFQGDTIRHSFSGKTLQELIADLISTHGERIREALWDDKVNGLDPSIQIMVNRRYIWRADLDKPIVSQGDKVTFLRLLAGG
jgi:molybdopterin converting factor small subunit